MKECIILLGFFVILGGYVSADADLDAKFLDFAQHLDVQGVRSALAAGANPNAIADTGSAQSALATAVEAYSFEGAPIPEDHPELEQAAVEIVQMLFDHGAKLRKSGEDADLILWPVGDGSNKLVELLLDHGANAKLSAEGYTMAELAIKRGHNDVYDVLLAHGASAVDDLSRAQLRLVGAADDANIPEMEKALASRASIDGWDSNEETALVELLITAVLGENRMEAVLWLLDHCANPNKKSGNMEFDGNIAKRSVGHMGGIPIDVAIVENQYNIKDKDRGQYARTVIKALLDKGAKVSAMDSDGRTPLHLAAKVDSVPAAEILISEGARIMARDNSGRTPLDYAESRQMIELLKQHGATEQ